MAKTQPPSRTARVILRQPDERDTAAVRQHQDMCRALETCGVRVAMLPASPDFPAACRVGDTAVVTESLAVISNFAPDDARQGEQQAVAAVLAASRFLKFITAPGLLDARDVAHADDQFYIGLSARTNQEGAAQLAFFLKEFGHETTVIDLTGEDFHLADALTALAPGRILLRAELVRHYAFITYDKIIVPVDEAVAATAVMAGETLILPAGCPQTRSEIRMLGLPVVEVDASAFDNSLAGLVLGMPEAAKGRVSLTPSGRAG